LIELIDKAEQEGFTTLWNRIIGMNVLDSLTYSFRRMIVRVAKPEQPEAWKEMTANSE
jgi:hypothetical protein